MSQTHILYNPSAGGGQCLQAIEPLKGRYPDAPFYNMQEIDSYAAFFAALDPSDHVILCGGDGTLNRFANDTADLTIRQELFLFSVGSGNDFAREFTVSEDNPLIQVNEYLCNLPTVTINGKTTRFINGVGFGIDGYCCEVGDAMREQYARDNINKPINYTAIAIKGLLFHYKPTNAKVTVDGETYTFKKVWIAPTMNGCYYGGGMMPTPAQKRTGDTLSVMLMHSTGKLKTLIHFPSLFKGEHLRHTKTTTLLEGHDITVEFDRPTPLQIDGETILGVTSYRAQKGIVSAVCDTARDKATVG